MRSHRDPTQEYPEADVFPSGDNPEEAVEHRAHHVSADVDRQHCGPHVQLLQGVLLRGAHLHQRDCAPSHHHPFHQVGLQVPIFIGASIEIKWTLPVIVEVVKLVFAEKDLLLFFFQHQQKHLYCDYLCNFTHFDDPALINDGPG